MLFLQKYKILGHSMEPIFKNGDKILVSGIWYLFKKPKINDIVAFAYKDKVLIKRIISFENNNYYLKGDNKKDSLDSKDLGLISEDKILGKFIFKL